MTTITEPIDDERTRGRARRDACERAYDRVAPVYDLLDAIYERSWKSRLRAELLRSARGRILDVGVGTGCNIPHYPTDANVVGIDSSRKMLERAGRRAEALGREVRLERMDLMNLAFPDDSFDVVVVTFVLLCLPEDALPSALRELRRVCKPDGQVLVLDYRLSEQRSAKLFMRVVGPWLRWAFAARYDAGTERHLPDSGFEILERRTFIKDGVGLLRLRSTRRPQPEPRPDQPEAIAGRSSSSASASSTRPLAPRSRSLSSPWRIERKA